MRLALLLIALAAPAAAQPVPIDTLEARLRAFAADLGAPRPESRLGWDADAAVRARDRHLGPVSRRGVVSVEVAVTARARGGLLTLDRLPTIAAPPQVDVQLSWPIDPAASPRPDARAKTAHTPGLLGTPERPAVRLGGAALGARVPSTVRLDFEVAPPLGAGLPFRLRLVGLRWAPRGAEAWEWAIGPPPPPVPAPVAVPEAPPPPPPASEKDVFDVAEVMPEIVGGLGALQARVVYPEAASEAGVEGRVFVQFIVEPDGTPSALTVVRSPSALLSAAAAEAVRQTRFVPGRQRGRAVRVRMMLPVTFRLR